MNGSLINTLMENAHEVTPEVGMGATILLWSDRHAATIVGIERKGKKLLVQRDKAIRTDKLGMSDAQAYTYERDEDADTEAFTLRKNGKWVREGTGMKSGTKLAIGYRSEYYDFSF